MYGLNFLLNHQGVSVAILGAIVLAITGGEALYSDMGHCGRKNIRISWIFVKTTLVLNYFGQAAYLIQHEGKTLQTLGGKNGNPFYLIMENTRNHVF